MADGRDMPGRFAEVSAGSYVLVTELVEADDASSFSGLFAVHVEDDDNAHWQDGPVGVPVDDSNQLASSGRSCPATNRPPWSSSPHLARSKQPAFCTR